MTYDIIAIRNIYEAPFIFDPEAHFTFDDEDSILKLRHLESAEAAEFDGNA